MINIYTTSRYNVQKKTLTPFAQNVLNKQGFDTYIVNIAFVGKRKMRGFARDYGHGDIAKPVLSFPMKDSVDDGGAPILGDVVICYPQAVLLAAEKDKTVVGMIEFLVEHGIQNLMKK